MWTNPPPKFLEKEISPFPDWIVWQALIAPRLELRESRVTPLGGGAYRVRVVVENTGWLPTYVTKKALDKKLVRGVIAEITLPDGASLASGKQREEFGQLEGRAYKPVNPDEWEEGTTDRLKLEWVVRSPRGSTVQVLVRHERAGVVRLDLTLK